MCCVCWFTLGVVVGIALCDWEHRKRKRKKINLGITVQEVPKPPERT